MLKTPIRNFHHSSKPKIRTKRTWMFFALSKSRQRFRIPSIGVSKISDHIQIKIKMPNPNHEPSASSKAPNEDKKDVLCNFEIKRERQSSEYLSIKDKWSYLTLTVTTLSSFLQNVFLPSSSLECPIWMKICLNGHNYIRIGLRFFKNQKQIWIDVFGGFSGFGLKFP